MTDRVRVLLGGCGLRIGRALLVAALVSACSTDRQTPPVTAGRGTLSPAQAAGLHGFRAIGGSFEYAGADYRATVTSSGALRLLAARTAAAGALQIQTRAFGRSGEIPLGSSSGELRGDGTVDLDRGAFVEHLEPSNAGVEQSWEISHPPAGRGDLVVSVGVGGLRPLHGTQGSSVFADDTSNARITYGQAFWVDGAGKRTAVSQSYRDGTIQIAVPAAVVDSSVYPAVLDPFIGLSFALEGPVYAPSSTVGPPSIAGNGTDYLVTWTTGSTIYASRVTGAGALLDPTPTVVVTGSANKTPPRAVWDGAEWFVVWGEDTQNHVLARRVRTDGTLIDQQGDDSGLLVASALATSVDVAFDGSELFVVYAQNDGFAVPHVYGVRVGLNGQGIDTTPIVISNAAYPNRQTSPRVAFDGTEFFVAWADSRASASASSTTWDIYGARVTHAGVLLDGPTDTGGTPISTATGDQTSPAVASDGSVAFVAWSDARGVTPAYYGARVDPSTGLLDGPAATGGIHLGDGTTSNAADVAFDGSRYEVVWSLNNGTSSGIIGARVAAGAAGTSAVVSPVTVTTPPPWTDAPAVAGASAGSFVGWLDERLGPDTLFGTRMDASGTFIDGTASARGFCISEAPVHRGPSVVGTNGSGYVAAWVESADGVGFTTSSIFAERLDAGGTPLDKPAFVVSAGPSVVRSPSVGSSGDGYVVTWTEPGEIGGLQFQLTARFIDANGALVNGPGTSPGLALTQTIFYYGSASIAFDGTDYLFVWPDGRNYDPNTEQGTELYGIKTSPTGEIRAHDGSADGSFPIVGPNFLGGSPTALDFDGTNFLLVWTDQQGILVGSRLATDGTRLDGTVMTDGFLIQAPGSDFNIDAAGLAYDGANHVVLTSDFSSSTLFALAISTSGAVSGPAWSWPGAYFGVLTYDGSAFWALRNAPNGASGIQGVRLRGDASPRDTKPLSIDGSANDNLAAAAGLSGGMLVTFGVGGDTHGVVVLDDATNGVACTSGDTCASGTCEDGVCCDRPCGGATPDCQACSRAAGAPRDGFCALAAATTVCRPLAGACDIAEVCDGVSKTCPADRFIKINTVCQAAASCASASVCTGTGAVCPSPTPVTNGTPCDGGICGAGACMPPVVAVDGGVDAADARPSSNADSGSSKDAGADSSPTGFDAHVADASDASSDEDAQRDSARPDAVEPMASEGGQDSSGSPPGTEGGMDASGFAGSDGGRDAESEGGSHGVGASSGCGCRVSSDRGPTSTSWWIAFLWILVARRRKDAGRAPRGPRSEQPCPATRTASRFRK
jgi:hypothetical protein